jgi:hypothetical protein
LLFFSFGTGSARESTMRPSGAQQNVRSLGSERTRVETPPLREPLNKG